MRVFSDFDGTITSCDTTDFILERFASSEWKHIEAEWDAGLIGSAECMQRQIALIQATQHELYEALDEVAIDPGFIDFVQFCQKQDLSLTIISDGVGYFIQHILKRYGLQQLPVIANHLMITAHAGEATRYHLISPFKKPDCQSASGVCKCHAVTRSPECVRLYIGDGRSDFCVSNKPDLVFAKGKLVDYCADKEIPFIPYQKFTDVIRSLKMALPPPLMVSNEIMNHHAFI